MNKIQYIELLKLRGVESLDGMSIAQAVRDSGGDPSDSEMAIVNKMAMERLSEMLKKEKDNSEALLSKVIELEKRDRWLSCLEAAGVDNWEGVDAALEMCYGE